MHGRNSNGGRVLTGRFACTCCGQNAWGEPGLEIDCRRCGEPMSAAQAATEIDGRLAKAIPAREFVRATLAAGPVPQKVITEQGTAKGFSYAQLRHARDRYRRSHVQAPGSKSQLPPGCGL